MKNLLALLSFMAVSASAIATPRLVNFAGTIWSGIDSEDKTAIKITIADDLNWSSTVGKDSYSGDDVTLKPLFAASPVSAQNPLVLRLMSKGKVAMPEFAVIENNDKMTLVYDKMTLSKEIKIDILSCRSSGAGGSIITTLKFERAGSKKTLKVTSPFIPHGNEIEVKILSSQSTPVSTKYELDMNTGGKTSLVVYEKQAVILLEANKEDICAADADANITGANVQFMICE